MKICGIIAEYNPFHEGHAYHMREAKRLSGADAVVVVMSGHFVQRGEPAITDPYERAEAALRNGADAVFMMPPGAGTASAEYFAACGVSTLDALGCDCISCGIEAAESGTVGAHAIDAAMPDIAGLSALAMKLADEDADMRESIRNALKEGMSYPAALAAAAGVRRPGPNSILAIEYLKAMRRINSTMEFIPVVRAGSGYNDTEVTEGNYPSAAALRKMILAAVPPMHSCVSADEAGIEKYAEDMWRPAHCFASAADGSITEKCAEEAGQPVHCFASASTESVTEKHAKMAGKPVQYPIGADDVMPMVVESIRNHMDELEDYADCSTQIAQRIRNSGLHYGTFEEMVKDIKTKDVTYARVARVLMHILLGIRQESIGKNTENEDSQSNGAEYAQLIGFSNREILKEINHRYAQRNRGNLVIISKAADHKDILSEAAYAADIYNQALWNKYRIEGKDFYRQQILKI